MIDPSRAVTWYSTLTPESLKSIGKIYHESARFRDPFNDVEGHDAICAIFRHMFAATQYPRFTITDIHQSGETAWLSWNFEFGIYGTMHCIAGSSRLDYAPDGRVISHLDYWDASELLEQMPFIGKMVRWFKKRLKVPQSEQQVACN